MSAPFKLRIQRLSALLSEQNIDGLLVTNIHNIRYLSNFSGSTAMMLVMPGKSFFFSDFRYTEQAAEEVVGSECVEIERSYLPDILARVSELSITKLGIEKSMTLDSFCKIEELKSDDIELVKTEGIIEKLRTVKDSSEVEKIRISLEVASKAFERLLPLIKVGAVERDLMAELDYFFKKEGGEKASFEAIIASGPRGAMPHGLASDKKIKNGEFVVLDFGTVVEGYCSDITRTVFVGTPGDEDLKVYNTVLQSQLNAIEGIKVGMKAVEGDALARDYIKAEGYGDYFGHGLGHGLGLEVHEGPAVSPQKETVFEEGMVFTVEPGIYLPGKLGVRIEDVVHLTDSGCEVLTPLSKELIVL